MKFLRLAALTLTFSSFSFAVNKDLIALQRDLEAKMDAMQQTLSSKIDVMTGTLQAIQNDSRRTADQLATLQESLSSALSRSLTPVNNLNTRVESMSEDTRALRDALADLSARLERMDAKITDLKNQMQIMQNPPAAPGAPGATPAGLPGQTGGPTAGPPAGMSAEKTYTDASRDQQTGNVDLAYQEYQQYLTYFPNTELAANAQYYPDTSLTPLNLSDPAISSSTIQMYPFNNANPMNGTRWVMICSVPYATDDRLSDANTANAVGLLSRSWTSWSVCSGCPRRAFLSR